MLAFLEQQGHMQAAQQKHLTQQNQTFLRSLQHSLSREKEWIKSIWTTRKINYNTPVYDERIVFICVYS